MVKEFLDVLDRTQKGPICKIKEWETKIIPSKTKAILKEHELEKTFDPENPINADDSLADEFWKAGLDLAVGTGMICLSTERIIKFTEDELKDALKNRPRELSLGSGIDRITIKPRKPEDKTPPITAMSCLGMEISENLYIPVCQSIAQYRVVDMLIGGILRKFHGRTLRGKTPYETLVGKYEGILVKEAMRRAGRPGMPACAVENSTSEYGQLGGYGVPGSYDPTWATAAVLLPTPLTTDYSLLHKVAHALNWGAPILSGHWTMIGGYFGSVEGATMGAIAAHILECAVNLPTVVQSDVLDLRYLGNCGREALWAASVKAQAKSRNSYVLHFGVTSQVSGPCTDMLLYESTTISIADIVSGCAFEMGTRPTGCKYPDYGSGLENKFCAEVLKSAAGLKRSDSNEIVKVLLPKYEEKLRYPPKGKSFTECFDLKTLKPTKEWLGIYEKVWKELEDLGLPRL